MVTQPPVIGLVACQTRAVDPRLLTCTYADHLMTHTELPDRKEVLWWLFYRKHRNVHLYMLPPQLSTHLPVLGVTNRVGLRVLDGDARYDQVSHGRLGELKNDRLLLQIVIRNKS